MLQNTDSRARLFVKGLVIGAVDIVAGVSGGTMAIIVGLYQDILTALSRFDWQALGLFLRGKWKQLLAYIPWQFLLVLTSGVVVAVILSARAVDTLKVLFPLYTDALLFGLMLASAYFVHTEIKKKTFVTWVLTLFGFLAGWFMVSIIPQQFPQTSPVLFVSGVVAVVAGLLPGLSGAFTLHILGQYYPMVEAVSSWNWALLFPFGVGMVVGILLFVRLVAWLLSKYHDVTIAVLLGLMLGSIRKIWPWHTGTPRVDGETFLAAFWIILGVVLVFLIHRYVAKDGLGKEKK